MKRRIICCAVVAMMMATHGMAQTPQRRMTIGELFTLVESGSKTLRMQKSGVDVSARGIEEAKSKRLPDVGASLQLSYNGNLPGARRVQCPPYVRGRTRGSFAPCPRDEILCW